MAVTPEILLARLDRIARALESRDDALALIALGSVGRELERLDAHSDLDFYVIARDGAGGRYLEDLSWLAPPGEILFTFKNSPDGHKTLLAGGVFCEWAAFDLERLRGVPYAPGRIVWKRDEVPGDIAEPRVTGDAGAARPADWLVGEALTNLYVGLARDLRGEKLSAMRFIQVYAVDRAAELAALVEPAAANVPADPFSPERRLERRHRALAAEFAGFARGYDANAASARAVLAFLERHFPVNAAMRDAILELCAEAARE